jgi:amino acid permease
VRSLIVWLITGVSLLIPNFTDFLNIAGSVGSAMIAFVLPPLLYLSEFKGQLSLVKIILNWAIIVFGAAGAIYSVYFSINEIVNKRNEN